PGFADGTSAAALARQAYLAQLAAIPGVTLVDVALPEGWSQLTGGTFNNVRLPERSEPFMPYLRTDLRGFGVSVTSWLQGALMGGNEFITGQRARLLLMERVLHELFDQCDVVVQTDPVPFDILGLPEIAFPIGITGAGVPIGTILGGLPYAEDRLLSVVAAYQATTDWHLRRPADPAPAAMRTRAAAEASRLTAEQVAELTQ
ncbi:amidase, partial [Micromonospora azadirachtae]